MDAVNNILQLLQTPGLYQVEINEADTEVNDRRFYLNWSLVIAAAFTILSIRVTYSIIVMFRVLCQDFKRIPLRLLVIVLGAALLGIMSMLTPIAAFMYLLLKLYESTIAVPGMGIEVATHFAVVLGASGAYYSVYMSSGRHWENILTSRNDFNQNRKVVLNRRIKEMLTVPE